tara:strand:- start:255 stop:545 length:291 start_codon:yes stop_codon:yes gene_type:complete
MSGGAFYYNQYKIDDIANDIQTELDNQGKRAETTWDWEDEFHHTYRPEIQERFKEAVKALRIAAIYAQRVDWYLSCDDGEDSFLERLDKELKELEG